MGSFPKREHDYTLSKCLQELLQRLVLDEPLDFEVQEPEGDIYFQISQGTNWIGPNETSWDQYMMQQNWMQSKNSSYKEYYMFSLLLLLLDIDVKPVPDDIVPKLTHERDTDTGIKAIHIRFAESIDKIWNAYRCRPKVKPLLNLCIRSVRKHMNMRDDSSFMTFEIPSSLRRLLMYHDIADKLCEAWSDWVLNVDLQLDLSLIINSLEL